MKFKIRKVYWTTLAMVLLAAGCANYDRHGLDSGQAAQITGGFGLSNYSLTKEAEDTILAIDPEKVTGEQISNVLSKAPAPRIINIHGGIAPQRERMESFARFLIGMGYPASAIRNPGDGTWTFSCYESGEKIAGVIAWYYEKEGLRPMIVGNSQGGMQAIRILDLYAYSKEVEVWSPLTWKSENRTEIIDPLTGRKRPVAGLTLPYVISTGAGGLTRVLPNQWDMNLRLRTVPDTVEEFTGFYKGKDLLGGDMLGYGSLNLFKAEGAARVRNIQLPAAWKHGPIPDTEHLLKSRAIIDRINNYHPPDETFIVIEENVDTMNPETLRLPWAEDVWFSIKKHWVIELQRLIRARRENSL